MNSLFRRVSIAIPALWLALLVLLPALLILVVSFLGHTGHDFFAWHFSLDGYAKVMDPLFLRVLARSSVLAGMTTGICLLVGYPFACALARCAPRHRSVLLLMMIVPFWTNSLIRTYSLVFMLKMKGAVSHFALFLGVVDAPFSLMYTELAVLIGMTYTLLPFMILPLYSSIEKVDILLVDAAHDLGASRFQTFCRIVLPLTMPGVIVGCMVVFLPALGMFYIPDILGGGKHLIVGNFIKDQFLFVRDWPAGSAASVILTVMFLFLLALYAWGMRRHGAENQRRDIL